MARAEFARILKPDAWAVLIWNRRRKDATSFAQAYDRLLTRWSPDYERVDLDNLTDEMIAEFFGPGGFRLCILENRQVFDFRGLEGRLMSSSYSPEPGHPNHAPMLAELRAIFDAYNINGTITLAYATAVYFGRLRP